MSVLRSPDERTDVEYALDCLISAAAIDGWGTGQRHAGVNVPYVDHGVQQRKEDVIDTVVYAHSCAEPIRRRDVQRPLDRRQQPT
jgi:hypothetical protein